MPGDSRGVGLNIYSEFYRIKIMILWLCSAAACDVTITQKVAERLGGMQSCLAMYGCPVVRPQAAAMAGFVQKHLQTSP